ncbi:MAG: alpha/beta hydrolase family protein [Terriglobales bacterium]
MRRCLPWFPLVLIVLLFSRAQAQGRIDCNVFESHILGQTVHYCVMLPPGYDAATAGSTPRRYPVLYYLHGLGDNEQTLFKSGGWNVIEDLRQQGQIGSFLVVAPEGRGSFYINSADGRLRYSDFFISEFIPYIEAHYLIRRERSARAITGFSMGGYGALRFAFAHPELFSSVSAESAAIFTESPQETTAAMHSGTSLERTLGPVFGDPIDVSHWNQNSLFVLAKKNRRRLAGLSIYFNCGRDDDFGFEKGAAELDGQLQAEGVKHEFHLYPGNHDAAYFLSHLGETLRFHSRAFAAGK